MHAASSFDYAVIRVVPRVELEEFVNAGVIVFCLQRRFLEVRTQCDEGRWRALWPELDVERVRRQVEAFERVARGDPEAGPVARLSQRERFHWMVAPRNTMVQTSPVHTGISDEPERVVGELLARMVPGKVAAESRASGRSA